MQRPPTRYGVVQRMEDTTMGDEWTINDLGNPERATIGTAAYNFSASRSVEMGYFVGSQVSKPSQSDLAATHVAPDAGIKRTLGNAARKVLSTNGYNKEAHDTFQRLAFNTKFRNDMVLLQDDFDVVAKGVGKRRKGHTAHQHATESNQEIDKTHEKFLEALGTGDPWLIDPALQAFHDALSTAPGNLPDYGLHRMFNQPVSDRYHLNATGSGSLTPISDVAVEMGLEGTGVAVSKHGHYLITRQGGYFPIADLDPAAHSKMSKVGYDRTGIASPPTTD